MTTQPKPPPAPAPQRFQDVRPITARELLDMDIPPRPPKPEPKRVLARDGLVKFARGIKVI